MLNLDHIFEIKNTIADGHTIKILGETGTIESYLAVMAIDTNGDEWHLFDIKQYNDYLNLLSQKEVIEVLTEDIKKLKQEMILKVGYDSEWDIKIN